MHDIIIRDANSGDFSAICALNHAEVEHTSPMDLEQLRLLDRLSCHHKVICVGGSVGAFVLAMRAGANYVNDNFAWFAARLSNFLYIDRVVVSSSWRGLRLGSMLYADLLNYARAERLSWVTCEYNIDPPNEPSRRFHDKFGFAEQGTRWLASGSKRVSLQALRVSHDNEPHHRQRDRSPEKKGGDVDGHM